MRAPAGLIIESSFTSVPAVGQEMCWFLPVRWLCRYRYSTVDHVRNVTCPILVVHSRDDELIRFRHGRRIFEAAPEPKRFLEIRGGHNDCFLVSEDAYIAGLLRFLNECLPAGGGL